MDVLYIVMPAYNEEANIESVVRAWYPLLNGKPETSRLVVADSGSTDRTHEILSALSRELPQLEILSETGKQHGPKLMALYGYAIEKQADFVFQTDSDGQTDPAEFDAFWNRRNEYAGIFGNRTVRGDGRSRAFVERVVCLLLKLYFGVKVPDANAPFRLMRSEILKKYTGRLPADYNIPNIMLTTYFVYFGEKTDFPVISFRERQGGENSINIRKICGVGWKALSDFHNFKEEMIRSAKQTGSE
ncbi:MAG: glycosyltransferase family 2 protein [Lachnospiraceae bacterium]|nr:glycosyltransferase family 2 protein [Lachnospiraceae bacterium]